MKPFKENLLPEELGQLSHALESLENLEAIGLSGSYAIAENDRLSDIDICVYMRETVPEASVRRKLYRDLGISEFPFFDVHFEVQICDAVLLNGVDIGLNWMTVPFIKSFLATLESDTGTDELLPGGLLMTKPLSDRKGTIEHLQALVPPYPMERAMERIKSSIKRAYFDLYTLRWLEKAILRHDIYLFAFQKGDAVDSLLTSLYAVNRTWYCSGKRIAREIDSFGFQPHRLHSRLESILFHSAKIPDLEVCHHDLKSLFRETVDIALNQYPSLDLPKVWP